MSTTKIDDLPPWARDTGETEAAVLNRIGTDARADTRAAGGAGTAGASPARLARPSYETAPVAISHGATSQTAAPYAAARGAQAGEDLADEDVRSWGIGKLAPARLGGEAGRRW